MRRKRDFAGFRKIIREYYRAHKRRFPWRETTDPYRILVSEIMLQQTQVGRVREKYPVFIKIFPDFETLARAALSRILRAWSGMGYNRRAIALKRAAEIAVREYNDTLPSNPTLLTKLPGVGQSTAGAIAAFAFNKPAPFIETNIRRVYIHHFFPKRKRVADKEILTLVEKTLDRTHPREWYWALMDYGAMLGAGKENPNIRSSRYRKQPPFLGSNRELRGKIVKLLLQERTISLRALKNSFAHEVPMRIENILHKLQKEGIITQQGKIFRIT